MKRNDTFRIALLALLLLGVRQTGYAQTTIPDVAWEVANWPGFRPGVIPFTSQTQETSGEDWAYDVELSRNTSGAPDGYIFAGYTTGPGSSFDGTCFSVNSLKSGARPKMFKTDLQGKVLWYKVYGGASDTRGTGGGVGEINAVIQTADGGYLGVGYSRNYGPALAYNPTGPTPSPALSEPPQSIGRTECPTYNGRNTRDRRIYVVKVDPSGNVQWEYLYGTFPNFNIDRGAIRFGRLPIAMRGTWLRPLMGVTASWEIRLTTTQHFQSRISLIRIQPPLSLAI